LKSEGTYKKTAGQLLRAQFVQEQEHFLFTEKCFEQRIFSLSAFLFKFCRKFIERPWCKLQQMFCNNIDNLSCNFSKAVAGFSIQRARLRDSLGFERKT